MSKDKPIPACEYGSEKGIMKHALTVAWDKPDNSEFRALLKECSEKDWHPKLIQSPMGNYFTFTT